MYRFVNGKAIIFKAKQQAIDTVFPQGLKHQLYKNRRPEDIADMVIYQATGA